MVSFTDHFSLTGNAFRVRIQKLNAQKMPDTKQHKYALLNEIAPDSVVTQAYLYNRLCIAVDSVNWHIKWLINREWAKVAHRSRTRLTYDLAPEGMAVCTQRALIYVRDSLEVNGNPRNKAKAPGGELKQKGIRQVSLEGNEAVTDILRLTCMEAGVRMNDKPDGVPWMVEGRNDRLISTVKEPAD